MAQHSCLPSNMHAAPPSLPPSFPPSPPKPQCSAALRSHLPRFFFFITKANRPSTAAAATTPPMAMPAMAPPERPVSLLVGGGGVGTSPPLPLLTKLTVLGSRIKPRAFKVEQN